MPPGLRSLINEQMTVDSLSTGDAKEVFTNIFKKTGGTMTRAGVAGVRN
jgi:hypothetical protein